jgi:hypothetical protein
LENSADHVEQGGLAGAVRSEKARGTGAELIGDVVDGDKITEPARHGA